MTTYAPTHTVEHSMTRLEISTGIPFDEFRAALEHAAPPLARETIAEVIRPGRTWQQITAHMQDVAPNGLAIFSTIDAAALLAPAGRTKPTVAYLIGNFVIAERMYRHDPAALLYAPLRVLIRADDDGNALFAIDQPSTIFETFENPEITAVGHELDAKIAALLTALGIAVPQTLR